jgi:16S rRNA (cytosine967-C5)-methyltransferase
MNNAGRLCACDVEERFLNRLAGRAERAGTMDIERHVLGETGDPWLSGQAGAFDRVLVDAPCTGTGTWRRSPGEKWRLTPERRDELVKRQAMILEIAAVLLKPGGRLVYATCSVLPEENGERVDTFLAAHPGFRLLPLPDVWAETLGAPCPVDRPYLTLSPASTGTDGFFCALLSR